ncbi:MAG TPA: alpha/beta fold hydrolase [Tepidisphaeraceae bacterium]
MPHTIIIDGIWARPSRWEPLRRRIECACGSAEIWRYNSTGCCTFEALGQLLVHRIRQLDQDVNLVGFSMGGLVARAAHLMDGEIPVRRTVFMNSPHAGSIMAYLLPLKGVRQMCPSSAFMKRIRSDRWDVPSLCVYNPLDTMVVPGSSTRSTDATESVCCKAPIHLWPIWSKAIHQRVVAFLKAGEN